MNPIPSEWKHHFVMLGGRSIGNGRESEIQKQAVHQGEESGYDGVLCIRDGSQTRSVADERQGCESPRRHGPGPSAIGCPTSPVSLEPGARTSISRAAPCWLPNSERKTGTDALPRP